MIDKYEFQACYVPALLCAAPFVAISFYFLSHLDGVFWSSILAQTAGGVSMTFALYYLFAFVCRHAGKWLEEYIFDAGKDFPTTEFLLDRSTDCSVERKQQLYRKIKGEFGIDLQGSTSDTPVNRQRIHEAVSGIRKKFFKSNGMVLRRNIQFGFSKNLAGGAAVATTASLLLLVLALLVQSATIMEVSTVLLICYLLLSLFGILAVQSNAKRYAHTLFDEYLSS